MATSPYTTTCLRVRQSPKGKDYVVWDTVLKLGPPSSTGKLIPLLLNTGTSRCTRSPRQADGIFPHLKPSLNSVLPVAWITRPAKDLRGIQNPMCLGMYHFMCSYQIKNLKHSNLRISKSHTYLYIWTSPIFN